MLAWWVSMGRQESLIRGPQVVGVSSFFSSGAVGFSSRGRGRALGRGRQRKKSDKKEDQRHPQTPPTSKNLSHQFSSFL